MPLFDITNPETIKFLLENYEKTARLRMRWNTIHADKLNVAATLQHKEKGYSDKDVFHASIVTGMTNVIRDYKSSARNRRLKPHRDGLHIPGIANMRKGYSIVDLGIGDPNDDPRLARPDTDLTIDPVMRPVNQTQKNIIFKGRPDFGRKEYLKNRYKLASPENRFYFPETSSWEYGWRLKDNFFTKHAPTYGRVCLMEREASRSGPQPDPVHYKSISTRGPNKCNL